MGPRRRIAQPQRSRGGKQGDPAVTPVIGAVLILGITILGIASVMIWGAPLVERVQVGNAQSAMVGEFEELRDSSRELSVPDHSRFPTIVIPRGEVSLQKGSRFMVTVDRDYGTPACDLQVRNWADTSAKTSVSITPTNCRNGATVAIYSVSGSTLVNYTASVSGSTYTIGSADFSAGDWLFRLSHASCAGTICAEAWIMSTDQVEWSVESASGGHKVHFDNGAIFSEDAGTTFLEREAAIGDSVFGSSYYGLWVRSLTAGSYTTISGAGSHQVYLSLLGNYDRTDATGASRVRIDVSGALAQGWCNALVGRNHGLSGASYKSEVANCGPVVGSSDVRSVCYARVASTSNACTASLSCPTATTGNCFAFRLLHARIYTSLAL
jgi:hypothetical protein